MNDLFKRLISSKDKYKNNVYNKYDFHTTIESIRNSATENEKMFSFLTDVENELEKTDYLVDNEFKPFAYIKEIERIESFLMSNANFDM